jgi:hypothetical protein
MMSFQLLSFQLREEKRRRVSMSFPPELRARIIAISGTTPDPPATRNRGPPSDGSQTK